MTPAKTIARALAANILALAVYLLPDARREGNEWICPATTSPFGCSVSIHLTGSKAGVWSAWSAGMSGDALDLVAACLRLTIGEALTWSRKWLGIDQGEAAVPRRPMQSLREEPDLDPARWRWPWQTAQPIAGTLAEVYLMAHGLRFDDPEGDVLRFTAKRMRRHPDTGQSEYHPALLLSARDIRTGEQKAIQNIFLQPDGRDRLKDKRGRTSTGPIGGCAVMLSPFDEPTGGLIIAEGLKVGLAAFQRGLQPVWVTCGAGGIAKFPVLGGIESLTILADADPRGQTAAQQAAAVWRADDREVLILTPPTGDWGDFK